MKPRHQLSRAAIEMIKRFEGYRRKAVQLPSGRWMLGHGHTLTAREGAEVSPEDAEALLLYDLIEVAHAVNEHVLCPLTQNQFDALCSFVFNIGTANFRNSAVLLRLNEGATLQAAACMELWRKADFGGERIIVDALVRRRAAEKHLFLTPPDGWVGVPSALLPPKLDLGAPESTGLEPEKIATLEPQPPVEPPHDPDASASERAAAAVGARLQQILPEPEPHAVPVLRLTPASEFELPEPEVVQPEEAEPAPEGPTLFDVVPPEAEAEAEAPRAIPAVDEAPAARLVLEDVAGHSVARRGWRTAAALAVTAVVGVALAGGSLAWGLSVDGAVSGLNTQMVGWVGGLLGVSLVAFAGYLFLRGLSDDV